MRLQRSKGFSMIEIIVSLSIFILILAVCIKLVFFSRIKEKHADKSLAYYLLASKLNYYLKNDLRAVYRSKIGKIHGEDRYSLYVSYENDKGEAKFKPISYEFNSDRKLVKRIDRVLNKTIRFDFSESLEPEEEFKFQIFSQEIETEYEEMHEFLHLAEVTW